MNKLSKIAFFSLTLIFVFTLSGCGKTSSPGSTNGASEDEGVITVNSGNSEINNIKVYKSAVEVELPDSPVLEIEGEIRPLLRKIFGDLKVTSYSSDIFGAGSMIVEYTPSQKPAPAELPKVTKALKDKGYAATMEHVDTNVGTAIYEGDKYTLTITINNANPVVGVSYIGK